MSWVNKHKLSAIKAIKYNNQLCLTLNSLWNALYSTFNTILNRHINIRVLDEVENKPKLFWNPFSKEEFKCAINNCNSSSTPGLDKLLWNHLKTILKQDECLSNIINIANTCINLGYWPSYFKKLLIVVIPKPNKQSYDHPKSFCPIVLLNMLGKLIEKVIGERLQFQVMANDFIHPSQLEELKFKSTIDVGVALMHMVCLGWVKNLPTSTLAFDIVQFFPSLNHCFLTCILQKAGLDSHVVKFFANYLTDRKTNYMWNNFSSTIFKVKCQSWTRVCSISYFVCSLSFPFPLYFRKPSQKF